MAIKDDIANAKKLGLQPSQIIDALGENNAYAGDLKTVRGSIPDEQLLAHLEGTTDATQPATDATQPKSVGEFAGNVGTSAYKNLVEMPVTAVAHPAKTLGGIMDIASGAAESIFSTGDLLRKIMPKGIEQVPAVKNALYAIDSASQGNKDKFKAAVDMYKDRYGGWENVKKTAYEDPVGMLTDIASLISGAGGAIKGGAGVALKAGKLGMAEELANIGAKTAKVGEAINPITMATKGVGMAAKPIVGAVQKVAAPFANKVIPDVAQTFDKYGVDPTAGMVSKSIIPKFMEAITTKGVFGGKLTQKIEDVGNKLNEISDNVVKSIGVSPEPLNAGKLLTTAIERARQTFFDKKDALYAEFGIDNLKIPVDIPETKNYITTMLESKSKSFLKPKELGTLQQLKTDLMGDSGTSELEIAQMIKEGRYDEVFTKAKSATKAKPITADAVASTLKTINEKLKNVGGVAIESGERAFLSKLAATLSGELDSTLEKAVPEMKTGLDQTKEYYSTTKDKLNKLFGGKVKDAIEAGDTDKIAAAVLNSNVSILDIPQMYRELGPESTKALQAHVADEIFSKARGTKDTFSGVDISRQINKYSVAKLKEIYFDKPEVVDAIMDLSKMGKALEKGKWVMGGSQTAFLMKTMATMVELTVNPLMAAKMILGDLAYSKFVSSPMGQQWMKNGFKIPASVAQIPAKIKAAAPMVGNVGLGLRMGGMVGPQPDTTQEQQ